MTGIALVVGGADLLVDGLLAVGSRLGISPFVLTVVLSGFELENLAAGIAANAKGLPGAAAGTVFGGVTFLALGVAGLGALIAPIQAELPRTFLLWTAVSPLPTVVLSLDGKLSRLDGAVLLAWFAVVVVGVARSGRDALRAEPRRRQRFSGLRLIGGLAVLTVGGDLLGESLRRVVSGLGVSATLLGNTAIAAGVEAEELGRVAVPTRRGQPELALGNIAGTIVHFIAFNAGVIALVKPVPLDHATRVLHMPVAAAATFVLCILLGTRSRLGRLEGGGLVAMYAVYVAAAISLS
ncbi:MAG: sodium:calcium antiporter [Solirubrobacteraceae bacterium]